MLSLATAVRANATDTALSDHVQTAAGGLEVLVGASTPAQASALDPLWPALGAHMAAAADCDVIADCGRLTPPSLALQLERGAQLLVLVVRATTSGMAHLRSLLLDLAERQGTAPVVVLPVMESRGVGRAEVDDIVRQASGRLHPVVVGPLAFDPVGAAGLAGEWTRRLDRTPLVESARRVAHELDALLAAQLTAAG